MKKILFLIAVVMTAFIAGCSKDEPTPESPFKDEIVGSWQLTHFNGTDVETVPSVFPDKTIITFNKGKTYSAVGAFGSGSGEYTLKGDVIETFVEGEKFHSFKILSIKDGVAELEMTDDSGTAKIRAKKV